MSGLIKVQRLTVAVAMLLWMWAGVAAAAEPAEAVVKAFYTAYFAGSKSGLPTEDEMQSLTPFLSSGLLQLIEDARAKQQVFIAKYPEEKPPLIEGDLFSSLFEGPTEFTVGTPAAGDGQVRVPIRFSYVDPGDSEATVAWEDAVILRQEGERWLIDDVLFLADWEFKSGATLRGVLAAEME